MLSLDLRLFRESKIFESLRNSSDKTGLLIESILEVSVE